MTETNDNIEFDQDKIARLQPFSVTDYINTDEEIVAYLDAILDDEEEPHPSDMDVLRSAIRDVAAVLRKRIE